MEITQSRAWDRRPNETDKAWGAFQLYMNMPLQHPDPKQRRSLENLQGVLGHAAVGTVATWSRKYQWVERARAYDMHMGVKIEEMRLATLDDYQRAAIQSTGQQLVAFNDIIAQATESIKSRLDTGEPIKMAEIKNLADAIKVKDDLMRRIARMPTDYKHERLPDVDVEDEAIFVLGGG